MLRKILSDLKRIKREKSNERSCEKLVQISKKYLTPKSKNFSKDNLNSSSGRLARCFSKNSKFFKCSDKNFSKSSKSLSPDQSQNFNANNEYCINDASKRSIDFENFSGFENCYIRPLRKINKLRISESSTNESLRIKKNPKTEFLNFEKIEEVYQKKYGVAGVLTKKKSFKKKMTYENVIKNAINNKNILDNFNAKDFILEKIRIKDKEESPKRVEKLNKKRNNSSNSTTKNKIRISSEVNQSLNNSGISQGSLSKLNKTYSCLKSPKARLSLNKKRKKLLLKEREKTNDFMNEGDCSLLKRLRSPKKVKTKSSGAQTNISSEFINSVFKQNDNLILDNRDLLEVNQNQFNTIQGLKEEIRKLVTLKQYYPESEELIIEEKECSYDTSYGTNDSLKIQNSSFKRKSVEEEVESFKTSENLKKSNILRASNFVVNFDNNLLGEDYGDFFKELVNFKNFLGAKCDDEICKFFEFVFNNTQNKFKDILEKNKEISQENEDLKITVEDLKTMNENLEKRVETCIKTVEEVKKNSKIELYDLLRDHKILYSENKSLLKKVECLERKLSRKSITNSPFSSAHIINQNPSPVNQPGGSKVEEEETKSVINSTDDLIKETITEVELADKKKEKEEFLKHQKSLEITLEKIASSKNIEPIKRLQEALAISHKLQGEDFEDYENEKKKKKIEKCKSDFEGLKEQFTNLQNTLVKACEKIQVYENIIAKSESAGVLNQVNNEI